jgi:hypothetical protein
MLLRIYAKPVLIGLCLGGLSMRLFPIGRFYWKEMIGTSSALASVYGLVLVLLRYFDELDLQVVERFVAVPEFLRKTSLFS